MSAAIEPGDPWVDIHGALADVGDFTSDKWLPIDRLVMAWPVVMPIGLAFAVLAGHSTARWIGLAIFAASAIGLSVTLIMHQVRTLHLVHLVRRAGRLLDDECNRRHPQ